MGWIERGKKGQLLNNYIWMAELDGGGGGGGRERGK